MGNSAVVGGTGADAGARAAEEDALLCLRCHCVPRGGRGWGKRGGFSAELGDDDEPGVDVTDSVAGSEGSVGSGAGARSSGLKKGKRSSEQTTSDSNRRSGRVAFAGGQDTDGRPAPGEGEVTRSFRLRVDGKRSVSTEISVDEPDSPGRIRMRAGESAGGRATTAKLMDQVGELNPALRRPARFPSSTFLSSSSKLGPGDGGTDVCVSRSPIRRHQGALSVTHTMGVVPSASLQLIINNDGDLKDYYVLEDRTLGKGTYGVVVPAKVKSTKAPRAVKSIAKVRMKEHVGALKYEIDIMKKIDHPYIIMLYEIFEDLEKLYLVTELCRGGHLHGYVTQNGRLNESAAALAMQQLFRAVFYLHRSFICHRDLKSENLLLSESGPFGGAGANNNCLKVADFGLSCIFKPKQIFTAMVGTPSHMAPEVRARKYNFACDYWSCGVIMYYVISGSLPFNMSTPEASRYKVAFSSTSWAEVSQKAVALVMALLSKSVRNRIDAPSALQHDWLKEKAPQVPFTPLQPEIVSQLMNFRSTNRFKRATLSVVAAMLSEKQITLSRALFMSLDVSGDGLISIQEMKDMLGDNAASAIFRDNSNNRLDDQDFSYLEFIAATFDRKRCLTKEVCKAAFSAFDKDGSNSISLAELASGKLLGHLSAQELTQALAALDKNGDQEIDFKEFMHMIREDTA